MTKSRAATVESMRSALAEPIDFDAHLAKAGQRDRSNVEKFLAACDPAHAKLWKRVARSLATLSPLAITTVGQAAVQFFIADGKYRMQVFAMEDNNDGKISIYTPDVLAEAEKLKLVGDDVPTKLFVEQLDASNTPNPSPHFKNMLGWNRKALRVTLPLTATNTQIEAAEAIAILAAQSWAAKTAS